MIHPIFEEFRKALGTKELPFVRMTFDRCCAFSGDQMKKTTAIFTNLPPIYLAYYGWAGRRSVCQCEGKHEIVAFGANSSESSSFTHLLARTLVFAFQDFLRATRLTQSTGAQRRMMAIASDNRGSTLLDGGSGFTFEAEYITYKTCTDEVKSARFLVRSMGIPLVEGPTPLYGDNLGQLMNVYQYKSPLKRKHLAICYHRCREAVAAGIIEAGKIDTEINLSDILTKALSGLAIVALADALIPAHKGLSVMIEKARRPTGPKQKVRDAR